MYRPEGWKPIETESGYFWMPDGKHLPMAVVNAFREVGADDMLEALRKNPAGGNPTEVVHGKLVFIPEE